MSLGSGRNRNVLRKVRRVVISVLPGTTWRARVMRYNFATHVPNIKVWELPYCGDIRAWRWLANWRTCRQPGRGRGQYSFLVVGGEVIGALVGLVDCAPVIM